MAGGRVGIVIPPAREVTSLPYPPRSPQMAKVELSVYASRAALRHEVAGRALTPYTPVHRTNGLASAAGDLGCDARRRPGAHPEPSRARPRAGGRTEPDLVQLLAPPSSDPTPQGHLTPAEATSWEGRRQWRNYRSHRDGQDITPPTIAVPMLKRIAADTQRSCSGLRWPHAIGGAMDTTHALTTPLACPRAGEGR